MYRIWYTGGVPKKPEPTPGVPLPTAVNQGKRVPAIFYRTEAHGEPVREWLKGLSADDRKRIGEDIKTVEFGWPIGMPVCKSLTDSIYGSAHKVEPQSHRSSAFLSGQKGPHGSAARLHQENAKDTE